jgi:phosphatidate phosphatase PAH1
MTRPYAFLCFLAWAMGGCGGSDKAAPARVASVVFDIDGTLTVGTGLIDAFIARPDAAAAVQLYVDKGYRVVYVTGRPELIRGGTEDWIRRNHFPQLPLYMSSTLLLDDDQTLNYKITTLHRLIEEEQRVFLYGYGDSTTDFEAYEAAGVPSNHTFALLRRGESTCQEGRYEACLNGYSDHLPYIEEQPDIR